MSRLLIRASAGSGKTFRLTGHFLRQLFLGHRPETILATTFTRKAAGEILGRVLLRLAAAAEDPGAGMELRQFLDCEVVSQKSAETLLAEVTRSLHRLRVCTLDSFFQLVARSLTLELGLPPGWSIVDEHVDRELRQQAIDAVLQQHASRDAQQLMQMLARGRSKRSIRELIDDTVNEFYELFLLTDREAWDRFPVRRRLTQAERDQAIRDLYACELPADKRAIAARAEDVDRFAAGQWEAFVTRGLAAKVFADEPKYYGRPLSDGLISTYQRMVGHATAELLDQLAQQTKATWELIARFDQEYGRLRSEHGWMRFSDVTRVLARSQHTGDGRRMHFRLDSQIRHLLLDEFQDTSPDQWRILKQLALSVTQDSGQSTFFCVGDGKQAIYGWRGGESAILDVVEETIPEIQAESLDLSRRSAPAVIHTVNKFFQGLAHHQNLEDYETACLNWRNLFPEHSTAHEQLPGFAELRTSPELPGDTSEDTRAAWHRWVAQQIRELHVQCPAVEIGVLTRRNATVARLVHELTLLNVPASEEGGTPPTDSPAVLAVMSLLHLASHPGCRISRFHVAGSPLAAVIGLQQWDDDQLAAATAARLRARLVDDGYGRTLQWLSESVRPDCSSRDVLRLQQIVAAGWQFDQAPSLNPADFVRLLENSRFSRSETAPVRVMTIHQSKGLEFPIVVLPELDSRLFRPPSAAAGTPAPGERPDHVSVWRSKALRPLLPEPLRRAFDQTTASDVSEAMCLLYVAMTRAMHALHMWIPPATARKTPRTYAGLLVAALTDDQAAPPDQILFRTGSPDWFAHPSLQQDQLPRVAAELPFQRPAGDTLLKMAPMPDGRRRGFRRLPPSRHDQAHLWLPGSDASHAVDGDQIIRIHPDIDPRNRGTLLHAWFECIDWLPANGDLIAAEILRERAALLHLPETVVSALLPEFFELLKQPNTRAALTRNTVQNHLRTIIAQRCDDADESDKFSMTVENERSFVLLQDGAIVQGTIDRLVVAVRNGKPAAAGILDFKTDACSGDRDAWLLQKREQYASQLMQYRTAVEHCCRLPPERISARLLLLAADAVIDL